MSGDIQQRSETSWNQRVASAKKIAEIPCAGEGLSHWPGSWLAVAWFLMPKEPEKAEKSPPDPLPSLVSPLVPVIPEIL